MKKSIGAILALSLLTVMALSACVKDEPDSGSSAGTTTTTTAGTTTTELQFTEFSSTINGIQFGLSPEQLLIELESKNIDLVMPDYSTLYDVIQNPIKDGRTYNHDASYSFITVNEIHFSYDADGTATYISVSNPDISTVEGLKIGDSIEKMTGIYGEEYQKDVEEYYFYQYYNGKEYLNVFCQDDLVKGFQIAASSYVIH